MSLAAIVFRCPDCHTTYRVPAIRAGKWHLCEKCRVQIMIPLHSDSDELLEDEQPWGDRLNHSKATPSKFSSEPPSRPAPLGNHRSHDSVSDSSNDLDTDESWIVDDEQAPVSKNNPRWPPRQRRVENVRHVREIETPAESDEQPTSLFFSAPVWIGITVAAILLTMALVAAWIYPPLILWFGIAYLLAGALLLFTAWLSAWIHALQHDGFSACLFFVPPFLYCIRYTIRNWPQTQLAGIMLAAFLVWGTLPIVIGAPLYALSTLLVEQPADINPIALNIDEPPHQNQPFDTGETPEGIDFTATPPVPVAPTASSPEEAMTPEETDQSPPPQPTPANPPPAEAKPLSQNRSTRTVRRTNPDGSVTETVTIQNGRSTSTNQKVIPPNSGEFAMQREIETLRNAQLGTSIVIELTARNQGFVWGGENGQYTADSDPVTAALHAGILKDGERGKVRITVTKGQVDYPSIKQNGVESRHWSHWPTSWQFDRAEPPTAPSKGDSDDPGNPFQEIP
ncbi:MAG: hypothetical protein DWH91_04380 [Planctomycetota bacterium]|nr:MAG: hypothetical protein DWH91_04380 [Planctomycetota bacterium]